MLTIEGSQGEGGGQILRTSLELSLVTRQPFRLDHIRARRQKPGLLRQHLTAVEAARTVGGAEAVGATLGSQTLEFRPGAVTPGNEHVTEIFTSFGECGRSAEEVAHEATDAASAWLRANVEEISICGHEPRPVRELYVNLQRDLRPCSDLSTFMPLPSGGILSIHQELPSSSIADWRDQLLTWKIPYA